jgi:hypothetical protein
VHCGIGSWGARCLRLGDYVTGTGAHGRGDRRRRGLMLPTLPNEEGRNPPGTGPKELETILEYTQGNCGGGTERAWFPP